jgi:hypothetical protein
MTTDDQLGARPSRRQTRDDLADWQARTFASETALAARPPGELTLDDEVAIDPLADREATVAHIAALRRDGLLPPRRRRTR